MLTCASLQFHSRSLDPLPNERQGSGICLVYCDGAFCNAESIKAGGGTQCCAFSSAFRNTEQSRSQDKPTSSLTLLKALSQPKTHDTQCCLFSVPSFQNSQSIKGGGHTPNVCSWAWTPSHCNSNVMEASALKGLSEIISSFLVKDNGVLVPVERRMLLMTVGEPDSHREW